jgi:diadenosine tetraphosphate (Ap4A) HIT family hydrolase
MHTSIHSEFAGITRHSRTQWFTAYTALSSEIGLSCLRRLRRLRRKLDASVEASGPHDFAVRVSAVRQQHLHVHRIPPRVRDDREPPLKWDGTATDKHVIWVGREGGIFLQRGLDKRIDRSARQANRFVQDPKVVAGLAASTAAILGAVSS